jgi:hypothetical protein
MKVRIVVSLVALSFLTVGCERNITPQPNGTNYRAETPSEVVELLPDHVFPTAKRVARQCEDGDFASCQEIAFWIAYGREIPAAERPYYKAKSHDNEESGHGDEEHAQEGMQDAEEHGEDEQADADHVAEDAHGEEDDHADDKGHGDGHKVVALEPHPEDAIPIFQAACDAGWQGSCIQLVKLSVDGHHELSADERAEMLNTACSERAYEACVLSASLARQGKANVSQEDASENVEFACERAYRPACAYQNEHPDNRPNPLASEPFNFQFEVAMSADDVSIRGTLPNQSVAGQVRQKAEDVFGERPVETEFRFDDEMSDLEWVQAIPTILALSEALAGADGTVRLDENELLVRGEAQEDSEYLSALIGRAQPLVSPRQVNAELGVEETGQPEDEEANE